MSDEQSADNIDLFEIESAAIRSKTEMVELPKTSVLILIKRVRQAELEIAVACSQATKMCADCLSAWCDSTEKIEKLAPAAFAGATVTPIREETHGEVLADVGRDPDLEEAPDGDRRYHLVSGG